MRRKAERECKVGANEIKINVVPCKCTAEDFECDQFSVGETNNCTIPSNIKLSPVCVDGVSGIPTGYVKKKMSGCRGGLELGIPANGVPCKKESSWIGWLIALVVLVCISGAGLYFHHKSRQFGSIRLGGSRYDSYWNLIAESALDATEYILGKIFVAYDWVRSKFDAVIHRDYRPMQNQGTQNEFIFQHSLDWEE